MIEWCTRRGNRTHRRDTSAVGCRLRRALDSASPTRALWHALGPMGSDGATDGDLQVKEGDEVAAGDVLCDVETDKATMGWENQDDGFVARILLPDGSQNVPVGTAALVIVDSAADIAAFKDYSGAAPAGADASLSFSAATEEPSAPDSGANPGGRA